MQAFSSSSIRSRVGTRPAKSWCVCSEQVGVTAGTRRGNGVNFSVTRVLINTVTWEFITGQNEREETTQDTIVTKSAAFASYEINYLTYITATYTRAKRRWHGATAHAPWPSNCFRLRLRLRLRFSDSDPNRGLGNKAFNFHFLRLFEAGWDRSQQPVGIMRISTLK